MLSQRDYKYSSTARKGSLEQYDLGVDRVDNGA